MLSTRQRGRSRAPTGAGRPRCGDRRRSRLACRCAKGEVPAILILAIASTVTIVVDVVATGGSRVLDSTRWRCRARRCRLRRCHGGAPRVRRYRPRRTTGKRRPGDERNTALHTHDVPRIGWRNHPSELLSDATNCGGTGCAAVDLGHGDLAACLRKHQDRMRCLSTGRSCWADCTNTCLQRADRSPDDNLRRLGRGVVGKHKHGNQNEKTLSIRTRCHHHLSSCG